MWIVGDVHGKYEGFKSLVKECKEDIVQVGDFGLDYSDFPWKDYPNLTAIGGNHDNYAEIGQYPAICHGYNYILSKRNPSYFYVSGAESVDRNARHEGIDWFPDEQLSYCELYEAVKFYTMVTPRLVISHDGPSRVVSEMFGWKEHSRTREALQAMFNIFQPNLWVFGHHHEFKAEEINGCTFICLAELQAIQVRDNFQWSPIDNKES